VTIWAQIGLATLVVAMTILIHLFGLGLLLALLRRHRREARPMRAVALNAVAILAGGFGLFALHSLEIWLWALVYLAIGVLGDLEQALYFSISTYVTIGYGDVVLGKGARVLGAIEGASGIILIGWSTAFFFSVVDRLKLLERNLEHDENDRRR